MPESEQMSRTRSNVSADDSISSLPSHASLTPQTDVGRMGATPTPETPRSFEEEKAKLCQQIDEKVSIVLFTLCRYKYF